jgi:hypothetical protein
MSAEQAYDVAYLSAVTSGRGERWLLDHAIPALYRARDNAQALLALACEWGRS